MTSTITDYDLALPPLMARYGDTVVPADELVATVLAEASCYQATRKVMHAWLTKYWVFLFEAYGQYLVIGMDLVEHRKEVFRETIPTYAQALQVAVGEAERRIRGTNIATEAECTTNR